MNHLKTLKRIAAVALMLTLGLSGKLAAQSCPESAEITITVNPVLTIPTNLTTTPSLICVGGSQTLTVTAAGGTTASPNFQWQYRASGAGSWTNYAGTVTTSGLTSAITPASTATGVTEYQVVITDPSSTASCGTATSAMATIEVKPDISIATDLSTLNFSECIGGGRSLTVSATGGSTITALTYVWEETTTNPASGTPTWSTVQSSTSNTYTPSDNAAAAVIGTRYYRVRVEEPTGNGCGDQTSSTYATVTVNPDMTFSNVTLANIVQCVGGTDSWTVTVAGGSGVTKTYEWEQSSSSSGPWAAAAGTNNAATYAPANAAGTTMFFRVTVRDAGAGCGDLVLATPVSSTIHAKPSVTAVVNENVICDNGSVTFTATIVTPGAPGCTLEWIKKGPSDPGFTPVSPQPTAPGTTYTTPALGTAATGTKYKVRFVCSGSGCCN